MDLPFLNIMLLKKPPSMDLQNALPTVRVFHRIASDQGNHFIAREVQQWAHDHGVHWSYHVPHHQLV